MTFDYVTSLQLAQSKVKDGPLWRFLDGTPLANDVPAWMADHARDAFEQAATVAAAESRAKLDQAEQALAAHVNEIFRLNARVTELEAVSNHQAMVLTAVGEQLGLLTRQVTTP